jgi:hypothetical protein
VSSSGHYANLSLHAALILAFRVGPKVKIRNRTPLMVEKCFVLSRLVEQRKGDASPDARDDHGERKVEPGHVPHE